MADITGGHNIEMSEARQTADELFHVVYDDLRGLAERYLARERPDHTLQPTALVHEAYVRLIRGGRLAENGSRAARASFFAAAARAMRHILVESARRKKSGKRGGNMSRAVVDPDHLAEPEVIDELLALHEALNELAAVEPAIAELVNLRYFAGLTLREAADLLDIAPRTADSYWAYGRAWLAEAIRGCDG